MSQEVRFCPNCGADQAPGVAAPPPSGSPYDQQQRPQYGPQYGAPPRPQAGWLETQFRDTNMVVLVLFSCCCQLIALITAIIVLITGQDPIAKKNAGIVAIIAIAMMVVGTIARVVMMASGMDEVGRYRGY